MEYINIKNSINQTTNVHKKAFLDIIKLMSSKISETQIVGEPVIMIVRSGKNVRMSFNFTVSKESDLFMVINNMKKFIADTIIGLFDLKPYNILMNYQGRH